jgi:hypothetical protein
MRVYRGRPVAPDGTHVPEAGKAAMRDASWFRKPGRAYVYHVVAEDGGAACNGAPLVLHIARPLDQIDAALRCRRPQCAGARP